MPLPAPNLDDLRFQQDLVNEARRRIVRYCPEWTDYNLSDPGITLIELFAWMTEMLVYRLNRVPDRNYVKFLELIGMQLMPSSSARAELLFFLSVPFPITPDDKTAVVVPQGLEVTTRPGEEEQPITFTTDDRLVLTAPQLTQLRQDADFNRNHLSRLGIEPFFAFRRVPQVGDTFYLGFDEAVPISGYVLRLTFDCEETQAVGVRREDPPWVWEYSAGDGRWEEILPSTQPGEKDTTGGLNNPHGSLTLYLPLAVRPDGVHGRSAYWIRCRLEARRADQGMYTESPRVLGVEAQVLGGTVWATHAVVVPDEQLGTSNGEPGQVYPLQHAPVLALREGETVQVQERQGSEIVFMPWERVADFSESSKYDRHFTLDEATGQIAFGPGVRQPDGWIKQYGRVPEVGRRIRITSYRYGGGMVGNVPAGTIQAMRSAVPYIDHVFNPRRAEGGRDQEGMDELKVRARRELRAQQRAVTAEDFENLAKGASRAVARVKCNSAAVAPGTGPTAGTPALPPGMVELLVVPAAFDALQAGDLSRLAVDEKLCETIHAHLDQYRLLTTTLRIREPAYLGVKVDVEVVAQDYCQPEVVRARIAAGLRAFLSPLPIDESLSMPNWEGWPFGRDLYVSDLYSLIQQVPGVKHVLDVRLATRPVVPTREQRRLGQDTADSGAADQPLSPVFGRAVSVRPDMLLCSLEHQIRMVEL